MAQHDHAAGERATARPRLIPIAKVDRAVLRIERWGSAEDRAALGAATGLFPDVQASRQAILDIAQKISARGRRR